MESREELPPFFQQASPALGNGSPFLSLGSLFFDSPWVDEPKGAKKGGRSPFHLSVFFLKRFSTNTILVLVLAGIVVHAQFLPYPVPRSLLGTIIKEFMRYGEEEEEEGNYTATAAP